MLSLRERLTGFQQWQVATRVYSPIYVARQFAALVGVIYRRSEFDALARKVGAVYFLERGQAVSASFEGTLDALLAERDYPPVDWLSGGPPDACLGRAA